MSRGTIELTNELYSYLLRVGTREEPLLQELRDKTLARPDSRMQISPEHGQFLRFLVGALGSRQILEIGVYTGYSGLCSALALPEDGRYIGLDVNPETTAMAREFFERAGLSGRFEIRLGPALETLTELCRQEPQRLDFVFIDADKTNYLAYYEASLKLLRVGGVIAVDNVLWGGSVIEASDQTEDTVAIRKFNETVAKDERVDLSLIPIGDGLTLLRKRG